MKKMFVLVLLVPILTIALISCDADIRSNIAGFMGGLGGNVYVDNEWVQPNTADAEAAVATIASLGTGSGTTSVSSGSSTVLGIPDVTLTSSATILAPQGSAEQELLKTNIANALNSDTQKIEMIKTLQQPATPEQVTAAQGTVEVFNQAIIALATSVGSGALADSISSLTLTALGSEVTQGDVLILQMMTNLISNTVDQLKDSGGTISASNITEERALAIVGDALFTAQVAEQLSGASTINFSGDLISGLTGLMGDDGDKSSRNGGDETYPLDDLNDSIGVASLNNLMPQIVSMFGIQKSGDTFTYTEDQYMKFLLNQRAYLASMNHAIAFYEAGNISNFEDDRMDVGTLIKYLIAFMVTTFDDSYENALADGAITDPTLSKEGTFLAFVNANVALASGTLNEETPGNLTIPSDFKTNFMIMGDYLKTKQADVNDKVLTKLAEKAKTLVEMTGFENEDLDAMLDDLPTTIDEWFEE